MFKISRLKEERNGITLDLTHASCRARGDNIFKLAKLVLCQKHLFHFDLNSSRPRFFVLVRMVIQNIKDEGMKKLIDLTHASCQSTTAQSCINKRNLSIVVLEYRKRF